MAHPALNCSGAKPRVWDPVVVAVTVFAVSDKSSMARWSSSPSSRPGTSGTSGSTGTSGSSGARVGPLLGSPVPCAVVPAWPVWPVLSTAFPPRPPGSGPLLSESPESAPPASVMVLAVAIVVV